MDTLKINFSVWYLTVIHFLNRLSCEGSLGLEPILAIMVACGKMHPGQVANLRHSDSYI